MSGDGTAPIAPQPQPRRRRLGVGVGVAFGLLALLLAVLASTAALLLATDRGTALLSRHLPGVVVTAPTGSLLGGDFAAARIAVRVGGKDAAVVVEQLAWHGLHVGRGEAAGLWARITLASLQAARVTVALPPSAPSSQPAPLQPPRSLRLPVGVEVSRLALGELHWSSFGDEPVRDIAAQLHLGADAGRTHRLVLTSASWSGIDAHAEARVDTAAPFALASQVQLALAASPASGASAPPQRGSADLRLQGPLDHLALVADLRLPAVAAAPGAEAAPAQSLQAQAQLHPFAAWPLAALHADASAFDVAALLPGAPRTALDGTATASSSGYDQPASVHLVLDNARAGRWDEGLLPLRHAVADLRATPNQAQTVDLTAFDAELGGSGASAGTLHASGRWTPARSTIALTLAAVQPALLDLRAPALRLDGHADAALHSGVVDLQADIGGTLADHRLPTAVRVELDASADAADISVRTARLQAGAATASVQGSAKRSATQPTRWSVQAQAALSRFDPLLWWPGAVVGSAHRGPTQLNATSAWRLTGIDPDGAVELAQRLRDVRGTATLQLADSTVLGVPLSADIGLRREGEAPVAASVKAVANGNTLNASGRLADILPEPVPGRPARGEAAASDAWTLDIAAPDLSRLAPLWELASGDDPVVTQRAARRAPAVGGSLTAHADVQGRWPALKTQGRFDAAAVHAGTLRVQQADGRWNLSTDAAAPAEVQANIVDAAVGAATIDRGALRVQGSGRAHDLTLQVALKALPPAWVASVQSALHPAAAAASSGAAGANETSGTTLALTAHGGLVDAGARFGGWRGTVDQLEARSGSAPALLHAEHVGIAYVAANLAVDGAASGGAAVAVQPASLVVEPGRLDLLGVGMRWSRIAWTAQGSPAQPMRLSGQLDLDPLPVAPFLAQAQPAFGWGGDLTLGAHADIHSSPAFGAEIVVERRGGDLTVTDDDETRALALTTLRVSVEGHDGVWRLTHAVAGNALGVLAGAVTAHAPAGSVWPAAGSPLDGLMTLQVADLGSLGGWVPPGWRLSGGLRATATVSGTLGAPQYGGQVRGTELGVRNFVQGVDVTNGDLTIALQGTTARIEHFTARGGNGTVQLDGNAVLGAAPQADLTLTAKQFQLLGRVDRRVVVSGDAHLALRGDKLALDGGFGVDEGLIDFTHSDAPTLADDVHVRRGTETMMTQKEIEAAQTADASGGSLRDVALNLRIGLGSKLRLRGHGLEAGLAGDLRLTSPAGKLAVNGTVHTEGGTYAAYGQKLNIDRGEISFLGNADNPRLDIEAVRPDTDNYRVGVAITGSALDPRVRLFSEPDLSNIDMISMLMLGHTSDGNGGSDMALLQSAALGLFSGEGDGTDSSFTKKLGLDELSVHQGSDNNVRDSVVSLGKQISQHWYVGYERGLGATAGSVQLIYRLAQRLTLRAQSGSDNSIDAIWSLRWK